MQGGGDWIKVEIVYIGRRSPKQTTSAFALCSPGIWTWARESEFARGIYLNSIQWSSMAMVHLASWAGLSLSRMGVGYTHCTGHNNTPPQIHGEKESTNAAPMKQSPCMMIRAL